MPVFYMTCTLGRVPLKATDEFAAIEEAMAYGARHGLKVTVTEEAPKYTCVVATIPPAWVADSVPFVLFVDTAPDADLRAN